MFWAVYNTQIAHLVTAKFVSRIVKLRHWKEFHIHHLFKARYSTVRSTFISPDDILSDGLPKSASWFLKYWYTAVASIVANEAFLINDRNKAILIIIGMLVDQL